MALNSERARMRRELAALREANDALRAYNGYPPEDISYSKDGVDPNMQDQPSNGG